jgi:hypothetical protein
MSLAQEMRESRTIGSYTFLVRPPEIRLLTPQNKQRLGAMQHFLTQ